MVGAWEVDVASLEGPRSLTVEELPEAVALSTEVFDPGGTSMGLQFPLLFSADNVGELRVFSEGGRLVSLVGCLHQTILVEGHPLPVGSIGSVCTRPEYRGRGLAGKLVSDVFRRLEAAEVPLALVSGDRGLYKQLGCVEAGCFERFEFTREDWARLLRNRKDEKASPGDALVRFFEECDLPLLHELYRREPLGFFRSLDQFDRLIWRHPGLKRLFGDERIVVAYRGRPEQVSAYAITRARTIQGGSTRVHIVEYAGSREDIIDVIGFVIEEISPSVITFTVPAQDIQFLRLLNAYGLSGSRCTLPGHTLYVTSFRTLLERLSSHIEERTGMRPGRDVFTVGGSGASEGEEMRWTLRVGDELVEIPSRQHLTRLVFGGITMEESEAIAPRGRAKRFLERAFPVPLPVPGLNYI